MHRAPLRSFGCFGDLHPEGCSSFLLSLLRLSWAPTEPLGSPAMPRASGAPSPPGQCIALMPPVVSPIAPHPYLQGALILLGAVCIGLGVIISLAPKNINYYYYFYDNRAFFNGVPFWMGSLFIFSGTFSVVGAQYGGKWVHLATFLNLGSVVAGSVAFTLGLTDIPSLTYQPSFVDELCKHRREYQGYRSWEPTTSLPYDDQRDQDRARRCQEALWALVRMWFSTQILLLILHSVALAIALFCFGYGLRRLCCSCWGGWKDYMAIEETDALPAPEEPGKEQNSA